MKRKDIVVVKMYLSRGLWQGGASTRDQKSKVVGKTFKIRTADSMKLLAVFLH
jgi:hypothetical protein